MTEIREISRQTYAIIYDGHALRQHYFTLESARVAAAQIGARR